MTEAEWQYGINPQAMLGILAGKASYRKARLFALAACRPILPLLIAAHSSLTEPIQQTIAAFESDAEGILDRKEPAVVERCVFYDVSKMLKEQSAASIRAASRAFCSLASGYFWGLLHKDRYVGMEGFVPNVMQPIQEAGRRVVEAVKCAASRDWNAVRDAELKSQSHLLRDIFGNPFCPVTLDPVWQTANVLALAEAIYTERAFDRMPILGDALEEAGCTNNEILDHCRSGGEHVRGCWVVDLLLGKA
jgi:hypothetical protein